MKLWYPAVTINWKCWKFEYHIAWAHHISSSFSPLYWTIFFFLSLSFFFVLKFHNSFSFFHLFYVVSYAGKKNCRKLFFFNIYLNQLFFCYFYFIHDRKARMWIFITFNAIPFDLFFANKRTERVALYASITFKA